LKIDNPTVTILKITIRPGVPVGVMNGGGEFLENGGLRRAAAWGLRGAPGFGKTVDQLIGG
jgi:hypothetical protein